MAVFELGESQIPWWGQVYGKELSRGFLLGVDDPSDRLGLIRHGDWNDMVIACRGNHLVVEINGEVTAVPVDSYGGRIGKIGFQLQVGRRWRPSSAMSESSNSDWRLPFPTWAVPERTGLNTT